MRFNIPFDRINWTTSSFLIGTLIISLTAVPAYIWFFGLDWFMVLFFLLMACATGFSITLGYHRLFSHLTFQAHWSVKLFTLIFGAAAFENSALLWSCEHRKHHKFVDHEEEDPYAISKGFFHAHIGWLLFKLHAEPPFDNVADLQEDPLVRWQHKYVQLIAVIVSFVIPTIIGYLWNGWAGALGGFLIPGVARVVAVQHSTFFINSMCHYVGSRPYSTKCSARDSFLMALFTFGEGYHNYHHEFQHDYRNGVKAWQFDPTKWIIWILSKVGLASRLRRVPDEKILLAELAEAQRQFSTRLSAADVSANAHALLAEYNVRLQEIMQRWKTYRADRMEVTREMLRELRDEVQAAMRFLQQMNRTNRSLT